MKILKKGECARERFMFLCKEITGDRRFEKKKNEHEKGSLIKFYFFSTRIEISFLLYTL